MPRNLRLNERSPKLLDLASQGGLEFGNAFLDLPSHLPELVLVLGVFVASAADSVHKQRYFGKDSAFQAKHPLLIGDTVLVTR